MQVRTKVRAALVTLAVVGGAAVAAGLGAAAPAVGQVSEPLQLQIQVASTGTLVAKGAGVDVSVTTECSGEAPGTTPLLQVFITERVGSGVAGGNGNAEVECTGTSQTSVLRVTAQAGKAFKRGTAVVQGDLDGCSVDTCSDVQDQHTITLS
jgi:hypothetical protein